MQDNISCNCITDLRASHLDGEREIIRVQNRKAIAVRSPREIGLNDMVFDRNATRSCICY